MISQISIKNYKSVKDVKLDLGRFNVFIGENGAGKSNVLEAIALAGAAQARKLDNEFLLSRGVRVTEPQWMRSAIKGPITDEVLIGAKCKGGELVYQITMNDSPYPKWECKLKDQVGIGLNFSELLELMKDIKKSTDDEDEANKIFLALMQTYSETTGVVNKSHTLELKKPIGFLDKRLQHNAEAFKSLAGFIIYSPENTSLRVFEKEGQIEPLGINGEGVLKLLSVLDASEDKAPINRVKKSLEMLGWFQDFGIVQGGANTPSRIKIHDRWLEEKLNGFDQKSANEGFLFLVFYFCLFATDLTPSFFAVDNVDASLNPKLCEYLVAALCKMSKESEKQVILTAHNPAVLDGLDLQDKDQRLFVISRGGKGQTRIRRVSEPVPVPGHRPLRLSESFIRGNLGGLPEGF
ncbi:chromosome segregation protein SMC [Pseudomonas syringae]|uniref:AAA family ATPase n=1 Tax=Pseudomonas syringae TaxID=317 RepID=UPI000CDAFF25|nr:AAA family ATPase [Pseudomonas syringae]POP81264.1 chromosome segregation protein SMC [Pseudomonas syringae]